MGSLTTKPRKMATEMENDKQEDVDEDAIVFSANQVRAIIQQTAEQNRTGYEAILETRLEEFSGRCNQTVEEKKAEIAKLEALLKEVEEPEMQQPTNVELSPELPAVHATISPGTIVRRALTPLVQT